MSATRQRIEDLFEAALDQPGAERELWLARVCADEPEVVATVLELIRAHQLESGILEEKPSALLPAEQTDMQDRQIGPYHVLRELGRGGMGVVYLAARADESFRRRVAVKLLRGSPDADELYQRFRAERHILASLSHNNIAQLLDGGIADGRMPYLVMEYVEGVPITTYCDRNRLDLFARLRLFLSVCAAVQHAHKNLVLHRDLKPGNILVNDAGDVKLLDFGIAKLLNPVLSGVEQPVTRTDRRVLTPQYASPEQVRGDTLSTASDVYSLGVVLYELLSGSLPYVITTHSPAELQELICEREPPRPSAAVRNGDGTAAARARATTPTRLSRDLRGDLDAIVLMALRKEANQRYGSAELLAEEIERYLGGKAVAAQRGSTTYRLRKLLRRHRGQVVAAGLIGLSLIVGAGAALWQASVARTERDRARGALAESQQSLQRSREITRFMTGLFEASDPGDAQGGEATTRELLRRGLRRADQLNGQPIAQAAMFDAIARVQQALGQYSDARALEERALAIRERHGETDPELAETLLNISDLMRIEGLYPEALARAERALEIQERRFGAVHPEVARTLLQVAQLNIYLNKKQRAIVAAQRAVNIEQATLQPGDTARFQGLDRLGMVFRRFGDYDEAERNFRGALKEAQAASSSSANTSYALMQIALLLVERGERLAEAEDLQRKSLEMSRVVLGSEHPFTIDRESELARVLSINGRHAEALAMTRTYARRAEQVLGVDHPNMTFAYGSLSNELRLNGALKEAESYARKAVAVAANRFGPEHMVAGGAHLSLGYCLLELGRLDEAEAEMRRALRIREDALGARTALPGFTSAAIAEVLIRKQKYAEAEAELRKGMFIVDDVGVNPQHFDYQRMLLRMAEVYEATGRAAEAKSLRARVTNPTVK